LIDVALALAHLRALADDEPVGAEAGERLVEREQPRVVQHHRHEARVEQVQHRVLVAADVAVHRQPLAGELGSNATSARPALG
jgi:chaperonin cofactor prefoldin